jgi:hypothetical protein
MLRNRRLPGRSAGSRRSVRRPPTATPRRTRATRIPAHRPRQGHAPGRRPQPAGPAPAGRRRPAWPDPAAEGPFVRCLRPGVLWNKTDRQATVFLKITEATLQAVPGSLDHGQDGYHDNAAEPVPAGDYLRYPYRWFDHVPHRSCQPPAPTRDRSHVSTLTPGYAGNRSPGHRSSQMSGCRRSGPVRYFAMYQPGWARLRICMSCKHKRRTRVSGAARGRNRGNGSAVRAQEVTA